MTSKPQRLQVSKRAHPLTADQVSTINRLATLKFQTFNESDVREEFLVPLIRLLGYERNSDYEVFREESYSLNPFFLTVGSKRIKLDYQFNVYKAGFWLLEAKGAVCSDAASPPEIAAEMVGQAHFYAHHREIDSPIFGVSNGWWTNIYDRDADDPSLPVLSIFHSDLPSRFGELYSLIGSAQIAFWIKRRLLDRIEQVLSADIDLNRAEEFIREANAAAARARPRVLENFRRNSAVREEIQNQEFRDYLEENHPFQVIDTLLMWPLNVSSMNIASSILARRVAQFPGSNQMLFFHRLLVREPRPVTIDYYFNALNLLGALCQKGELKTVDTRGDGRTATPIVQVYVEFVRLLLFHFAARPDLQVIWAMEGLLKRMTKRAVLSNRTARHDIAAGVDLQRYLKPEEEIAYLGPSPGRTLVEVVESITLAELGAFYHRHAEKGQKREFDLQGAIDEFQMKRAVFEPMEDATDAAYQELVRGLGQEWSELTWSHNLNRTWDRLSHGVCEIVFSWRGLLVELPEDCRAQLVELARLGNTFARQAAEHLGISVPAPYPDARERLKAIFTLGTKQRLTIMAEKS